MMNPINPLAEARERASAFMARSGARLRFRSECAILPAALLSLSAPLVGQTAPASSSGSSGVADVELSPFVVQERADAGWIATETLAGTRLRTNLKDLPNQIETLTAEFMRDLGLTSLNEALIYSANVENTSDYVPATATNVVATPTRGGREIGRAHV